MTIRRASQSATLLDTSENWTPQSHIHSPLLGNVEAVFQF